MVPLGNACREEYLAAYWRKCRIEPALVSTQAAETLQRTRSARRTPSRRRRVPVQSGRLRLAEDGSVSFHHFRPRDGNNKTAAPLADVSQLLDDFVPEIPGQNQDVIRLSTPNPLGRVNGYMRTGEKMVLLVRTDIHCVIQEVLPDSAKIEQCIS